MSEEHSHNEGSMPEGEEEAPRGVRTMAIIRWSLVALMAVVALASTAYYFGLFDKAGPNASAIQFYCPMHPSVVQDQPGECPICSMSLVPKEPGKSQAQDVAAQLKAEGTKTESGHEGHRHEPTDPYVCPMHPEETGKDGSSRCPICRMKLERRPTATGSDGALPVDKQEDPHQGQRVPGLVPVDLTPERIQLMGMKTALATRKQLRGEVRTVGFVAATEKGLAQINTRFAGWIEQLFVAETGQRVRRGQVLATIYSPELLAAQQEFLNAQKWSTKDAGSQSPSQTDRLTEGLEADAARRLELLGIAREDIAELARTAKPVRALKIRSPVEGYVIGKNAVVGLYVQPGTELFAVADLSTVWVLADVYEYEVGRVRLGQPASLELTSYRGERFNGRIEFIYPTLDTNTRTLRVRLVVKNPGLKLRPGMYGDVTISLPSNEGLVVPSEAIVDTGEVTYVFLARDGGRFEPRRVKVGASTDDETEIIEGLREGDVVVTTANFLIDSESRLHAAISGQGSAESPVKSPDGANCDSQFDKLRFPDKHQQCRACEVQHRGMGTMEDDCKKAIAKPWR